MEYQLKDFKCCPKCCGFVVLEDCFIQGPDVWLQYVKCVNCGWRYEVKQTQRKRKAVVLK